MNVGDDSIAAFLAKHVRPYDAATDDYERPPFAEDIKESKTDSVYNAHSYHTKVPPRGIIPYILHYTRPGDVVLDPFCGSGMTGVAAQMCVDPPADILEQYPSLKGQIGTRACILSDLSPAACHIAYNYNTPVDIAALQREVKRINDAVKSDIDWLYRTEHYEPAVGVYDLNQFETTSRLKNPPAWLQTPHLADSHERSWELMSREEVELRLGYSLIELQNESFPSNLDLSTVKYWLCIPATIQYTVWSDVYRCEGFVNVEEPTGRVSTRGANIGKPITRQKKVQRGCGSEFSLWEVAVDLTKGVIADKFSCPHCQQNWEKRQLQKQHDAPVLLTYEYQSLRNSRSGVEARTVRRDRRPSRVDLRHLSDIASRAISTWCPAQQIDMGREMMRHGMSKQNLSTIGEFWTVRNRHALSKLWSEIQKSPTLRERRALEFAFTAMVMRVSRRRIVYCPKGGGWASTVISGTLYIPSLNAEAHVWNSFEKKAEDVLGLMNGFRRDTPSLVYQGDAANISSIPNESVDYIFSDPPFGKNIYYADCSLLWEGWLNNFTDEIKEIVVNERRVGGVFKKLADYGDLMQLAFGEMFRVLKPNRFATIEFNNSDGAVFEAIKMAVTAVGFQIDNMLLFDKTGKTYKQMKAVVDGEDVVDKDVLFNLHKPGVIRREVRGEDRDLEQQVAEEVKNHLSALPARITADPLRYSDDHRTTATINSMLMNVLIPRGISVERLNLPFIERVCSRFFRKVGQRWYLRGESVVGENGELITEEITVADELTAIAWLRQKLQSGPKLIGELKPLWMRATGLLAAKLTQSLSLELLLKENFWRDAATNRWREPTPEEREKINDDRALRVLHDADRLAAGLLGRSPANRELCEWIAVLFDTCKELAEGNASAETHPGFDVTEAYQLIVKLSHRLTPDDVELAALGAAQKQARVAGHRLAAAAEKTPAAAKRARPGDDDKQTVLEF